MSDKYILDANNKPVRCDNTRQWGKWMETNDRSVAKTTLLDCTVSTVFLGIDHGFGYSKTPVLFETLVFGGKLDGEMTRCSRYSNALQMHVEMLEEVLKAHL